MPAGKLETSNFSEINANGTSAIRPKREEVPIEELTTEGEFDEMLAMRDEEEKGDPMDFPPDYQYLIKELGNRGGIRIDNCQEIEYIQSVLYENIKEEELREGCLKIFTLMVNYSNLWIIHFNKHKS